MTKNLYLVYCPISFWVSAQYEIQEGCYAIKNNDGEVIKFTEAEIESILKICSQEFLIKEICISNNI